MTQNDAMTQNVAIIMTVFAVIWVKKVFSNSGESSCEMFYGYMHSGFFRDVGKHVCQK